MDIFKNSLGIKNIDICNNFTPQFVPVSSKQNQISKIRTMINKSNKVILATDDDREGEAIAWHICKFIQFTTFYTTNYIS